MWLFLDSTGLAHFWNKAKEYIKSKYVGIGDAITISKSNLKSYLNEEKFYITDEFEKLTISSTSINFDSLLNEDISGTVIENGFIGINENGNYTNILPTYIVSPKLIKINGTSSQFLMADGSVSEFNKANGVPKLDANGKLDSTQVDALTDAEIDTIVV